MRNGGVPRQRGRRDVRKRSARPPGGGTGAYGPDPVASIESAEAYFRGRRPIDETELLTWNADSSRERRERLRLPAEKRQRIPDMSLSLLEALADFQGTEEGRVYPGLPRIMGDLLRLTGMQLDQPTSTATVTQLQKSDRLLEFTLFALVLAREDGWTTEPTATELMAISVARGLEEPTQDKARRLDTWRKRVATARRLVLRPDDGPTYAALTAHWRTIWKALARTRPWLKIAWRGRPLF